MTGTMTWVGFDVHARSTHGAAIDTMTGELSRVRFGPGIEGPLAWLSDLPGPVRACYEAGPTGFGLYRAATAAGIGMQVIAPGKTPRGPSDRVKTDRKPLEVARRAIEIAEDKTEVIVLANRVRDHADLDAIRAVLGDRELIVIPEDPSIARADRDGLAPIDLDEDSPGVTAVVALVDRLAGAPVPA